MKVSHHKNFQPNKDISQTKFRHQNRHIGEKSLDLNLQHKPQQEEPKGKTKGKRMGLRGHLKHPNFGLSRIQNTLGWG
ncbi:hypothetical protein C1H46_031918 [Malus baccata]|uniref:Uncharacterized protein n=1 Tax=Malus baccata TaxID=106549 RepID=A0A540L7S5_MALBA|nr:hypothetical protein C1H46_031918 [Malus baccata]